jgi:hypothetical protein
VSRPNLIPYCFYQDGCPVSHRAPLRLTPHAAQPTHACAVHASRPRWCFALRFPVPRQLASIGWQQVYAYKSRSGVVYVAMTIRICCKCMFQMFQLFQTYVASVLSGYCICCSGYTCMLQVYVLNVSPVSNLCCICCNVAYVPNIC